MRFPKSEAEVRDAVGANVERLRRAHAEVNARFERDKNKGDLARLAELEAAVERHERVLRNLSAGERYELTEQDLLDFGF